MGIFSTIMEKIFSKAKAAPAAEGSSASSSAPGASVDVNAVLTSLATAKGQSLNWKTSIVDLLKLLDMDSSMEARKKLADELKYTGSKDDSAAMNVWLSQQVVKKLAENGGKMPDSLSS